MDYRVGIRVTLLALSTFLLGPGITLRAAPDRPDEPRVQANLPPLGAADLTVDIRQANGDALPGTAKIRLIAWEADATEVTAVPQQRHRVKFRHMPLGPMHLEVLADGFATADLRLILDHPDREQRVTIYLRPNPKPGQAGDGWMPALSHSASTHYSNILASLHKGQLSNGQQHYVNLRKSSYGHPSVQYLEGVVEYKSQEPGMALFHFSQASYLNPDSDDSTRALGELLYHSGIYRDAYQVFAGLAQKHPDDWEPSWKAASAAFRAAEYTEARERAREAFQRDAKSAGKARLLLALADAQLKNWGEAHQAAANYLSAADDPALAATAKDLLAAVGAPDAASDSDRHPLPPERAEAALLSTADFEPRLPPRLWAPPDVDDSVPALTEGESACNTEHVLELAGQRVTVRFEELKQFAATEHIDQVVLDAMGRVTPVKHFTVDYLVDIQPLPNNTYMVDEFLSGDRPEPSSSSPPVAKGLAALAIVFLPPMQSDFVFQCEGVTQWNDHPAWSVHFIQRKDVPPRLRSYLVNGKPFFAYLRGRGIVDQASGELVHMETDLEDPIPEVRLEEEHLVVDYKPVTFKQVEQPVYLPSSAELYVHLHGHLYRVNHSFEKFVRFSVTTKQKIRPPKQAKTAAQSDSTPNNTPVAEKP